MNDSPQSTADSRQFNGGKGTSPGIFKTLKSLFLCAALAGFPLTAEGADTGGMQSPFELGGSARVLGMGDAGGALAESGDGFFGNPAALASLTQHEILTFHAPLLLDTLYDSIGYFQPFGAHQGFGAVLEHLGTSGISKTVDNVQSVSSFSSDQFQGVVGCGFEVREGLGVGVALKYVYEQLDTYQGGGAGMDLGVLYRLSENRGDFDKIGFKNVALGFSVSNFLAPQVKLFQTADRPARVYRPALSYLYEIPATTDTVWLVLEGEMTENGSSVLKGGMEYGWNRTVFGRMGFDGTSLTGGAGVRLAGFEVDYAFGQREMGSVNRFSLTYRFEPYQDAALAQKMDILKWVARGYTQSEDYEPALKAWQNVLKESPGDAEAPVSIQKLEKLRVAAVTEQIQAIRSAMGRGDFEKAMPFLAKAMSLDPENPEIKALLRQANQKWSVSGNYVRGVEAYSKEDYATAVQYLRLVYEVDPQYRNIASLYHDAESHSRPLESMSKEETALYAKGVDFYMNGDYQKAIEAWQGVLRKNPKNFLVRRNIEEARGRLRNQAPATSKPGQGKP